MHDDLLRFLWLLSTSSCHFDYINLIIRLVRLHYIHLSSVSLDFFFRRCRSCWADSCNSIFGSGHNDIKGRTIHNHAWEAKRADGTVAIKRNQKAHLCNADIGNWTTAVPYPHLPSTSHRFQSFGSVTIKLWAPDTCRLHPLLEPRILSTLYRATESCRLEFMLTICWSKI